jgi:hypothetical protein
MATLTLSLIITSLMLGVVIGAGAVLLLRRRSPGAGDQAEPLDEWTAAAIDQAAAKWVRANHLPDDAAGLVADKLRLLHKLGTERG